MITYKRGDLLNFYKNREVDVILHCANCQSVMGGGIALQIKLELPYAYDAYLKYADDHGLNLGTISCGVNDKQAVVNLHAQHLYGSNNRFVNYEALYTSMERARDFIDENDSFKRIGVPAKMASDRAGGSWSIVKAMVDEVFKDHDVLIVEYDTSAKSKDTYMMDFEDVENHINDMVSQLSGYTSNMTLSVIEKWVRSPDCNKNDLLRIKDIVDPHCSIRTDKL